MEEVGTSWALLGGRHAPFKFRGAAAEAAVQGEPRRERRGLAGGTAPALTVTGTAGVEPDLALGAAQKR